LLLMLRTTTFCNEVKGSNENEATEEAYVNEVKKIAGLRKIRTISEK